MSRLFLFLSFVHFAIAPVRAQDCAKLDGSKFFASVQFGKKLPGELAACINQSNTGRLEYEKVSASCKKNYSDLFQFMGSTFHFLTIATNGKGQVFAMDQWTFLDPPDSAAFASGKYPGSFVAIYDKLVAMLGAPAQTQDSDDMVMKKTRTVTWDCNNLNLELRITFGSDKKDLNVLAISVRDRRFELVKEQEVK